MKFCYLGNFKFHWCTEVHISGTLELLGHKIIRLQEGKTDLDTIIKEANRSDMFLWTRTPNLVNIDGNIMLKNISPIKVSYHLDLYMGISREKDVPNDPFFKTDFVFQADGDPRSLKKFKDLGINAYYMKPGVFAPECYLTESRIDLRHDLVFIGSNHGYHREWTYRRTLIEWLAKNYKDRFRLYPNKRISPIMGHELNQLMASTKIVIADALNVSPDGSGKLFDHTYYWSNRIVEETGRGGFVIHPRVKGLEENFEDKKHIVMYDFNNFKQLKELIDYYLAHDEEREKIRLLGHAHTKQNHTFHHRLEKMFEILKREGAL